MENKDSQWLCSRCYPHKRTCKKKQSLREKIHEEIERRFSAQQPLNHKPYNLSYSHLEEENVEGNSNVIIEVETAVLKLSVMPVDIKITDKNGNVTYSSKQEREQQEQDFITKTVQACREDQLSRHLMGSYKAAVSEPESELVRLYEIRDALAKCYGGGNKAIKKLNFPKKKWSRLGTLCNTEPLKEGRHKGEHIEYLRNASEQELNEARELVKELMVAHFELVLSK